MATAATFNPATYDSTTGTGFTLGDFYENGDGNVYRFLKTTDAVNITNGMVLEWASTTAFTATADRAGGSALGAASIRPVAGVAMGNVTAGNYGFFMVRGRHSAVKDAANALTAGVKAMEHNATDGDAAPSTAYTSIWFGTALANASGGSFPCEVRV